MIFAIDGRELPRLHIINYSIKTETLDGEATGRTKAYGWPMIRDAEGQIINLAIEFATTNSKEPDFIYLWNVIRSMGNREFCSVKFVDPTGATIQQNMYVVMSELRYRRIEKNGIIYTDSIRVAFIAEKGT